MHAQARVDGTTPRSGSRPLVGSLLRLAGLLGLAAVLAAVVVFSLWAGTLEITPEELWAVFTGTGREVHELVIWELRAPRAGLAVAVGAALGVAGALLAALSRNRLADPVFGGAGFTSAAFVVLAVGAFRLTDFHAYIWFAFLGAALALIVGHFLPATRAPGHPLKRAFAAAGVSLTLAVVVHIATTRAPDTFAGSRMWVFGSLNAATGDRLAALAPYLGAGLLFAFVLMWPLRRIDAPGATRFAGEGGRNTLIRAGVALTLVILCGAATAATGPIAFLGLAAPALARMLVGDDVRWIAAYSAFLGPILLIAADLAGRTLDTTRELEAGLVTAVVGVPLLIVLAWRMRAGRT
ncbi:iron ABC transporter permease [Phytomonospora sp. NPDC050363]|uniref:FecCD family ABC transporter permease n=1 Tax=Phytomonospora sp. NPDC050363 TaxID=3155642 RepID=UPI003407D33D